VPAGGFTRAGQVMTSCRLQSNYSSMVTLHKGPVVLHPISVTPCFKYIATVVVYSCAGSLICDFHEIWGVEGYGPKEVD